MDRHSEIEAWRYIIKSKISVYKKKARPEKQNQKILFAASQC